MCLTPETNWFEISTGEGDTWRVYVDRENLTLKELASEIQKSLNSSWSVEVDVDTIVITSRQPVVDLDYSGPMIEHPSLMFGRRGNEICIHLI